MIKKLVFVLSLASATILPVQVLADGPLGRVPYTATVSGAAFSGLAINSAKTTDAIRTNGWNEVTVWIDYTYSSASYVNMTCKEYHSAVSDVTDTSAFYSIPMCNDSSPPDSTCEALRKRWNVRTSNAKWRWRIPVMGKYFSCSFITTGGDGGDVASVTYVGGHQ